MVSTNIQKKQFPKLYNYKNEFICELVESINIVEELRFGSLSTLTFEYPYYQLDAMNNVIYDSNNRKIKNPKIDYIENDFLCLYNNSWYIIKIDETVRNENNAIVINVTCHSIGYELQEKIVEYLYIQPPISVAVNATSAISEILEAGQQVRDNIVSSATPNTVTLDINAFPVTDYYKGFKIKIVSGVGVGQVKTITSYNHTTKQCVVDSNWTVVPTNTSVYRIYNDIWRVGTIDPVFNTVLRSHVFDYVNVLEALQTASEKYINPTTDESGYLTYSASFDIASGRWIKIVNLVKPNDYAGVQFRYKKNMKSVNRQKFSNEIYTRIIPIGNDNLGVNSVATTFRTDSSISYPDHVLGHNYIDNFQYFLGLGYTYKECVDNFSKVYKFQDDKYTVAQDLYNDCKKILNKISLPKVIYQVSALDLSRITGREYESFKIGDTIKIYDEELNFDVDAVISHLSIPQINPQNTTVELTNFIENISDILRKLVNKNDGYTDTKALYGKTTTFVIADKLTSKNWRYADYVVREFETLNEVLNKLINSIDINIGAKFIVLEGDYYLNGSIYLRSNISLEGQGASTRLIGNSSVVSGIFANGDGNIPTYVQNVRIKNIRTSLFSSYHIQTSFCDGLIIDGVLTDGTAYSIWNNSSKNITISNCNTNYDSVTNGLISIYILSSSNINVYANNINNSKVAVRSWFSSGAINIHSNVCTSNTDSPDGVIDVGGNDVYVGWENDTSNIPVNVYNNTITLPYALTASNGISIHDYRGVNIYNNIVNGGANGLNIYGCIYCNANNNKLSNYGVYGIHITKEGIYQSPTYSGRHTIQANTLTSITPTFQGFSGIVIGTNLDSSFITNNDLLYSCGSPSTFGLIDNGTNNTKVNNRTV